MLAWLLPIVPPVALLAILAAARLLNP